MKFYQHQLANTTIVVNSISGGTNRGAVEAFASSSGTVATETPITSVMVTATATTVTASKNLATSSSVTRCYPETIS